MTLPELKDGEHIVITATSTFEGHHCPANPMTTLDWCKEAMQDYVDGTWDTETRMEQLRDLMHWLGLGFE